MTSHDVTALAAIAVATLVAVGGTASLLSSRGTRTAAPISIETSGTIIWSPSADVAIIRGPVVLMVGPEGPETGWGPTEDFGGRWW